MVAVVAGQYVKNYVFWLQEKTKFPSFIIWLTPYVFDVHSSMIRVIGRIREFSRIFNIIYETYVVICCTDVHCASEGWLGQCLRDKLV